MVTITYDNNRASWGAKPNTNPRPVPHSARIGVSWHWAGPRVGLFGKAHSACLSQVRSWQAFHQGPSRGWADIGYNLLICPHALVIEGRGTTVQGSHSPGVNYSHYGVQFMVGEGETITAEMFARAVRLRADLEELAGHALRQWGHQDDPATSTECPGSQAEAWVKSGGPYKSAATPPVKPPAPTAPPKEEDVMASIEEVTAALRTVIREEVAKAVWTSPRWTARNGKQYAPSTYLIAANEQAHDSAADAEDVLEVVTALKAATNAQPQG